MKNQDDTAISDYSQVISLDPKFVRAYFARGLAYEGKDQYGLAIVDYNQAIALDSQCSRAYYRKGYVSDQLGHIPEAINAYRQFIVCASPQQAEYVDHAKQRLAALEGATNQKAKECIDMQCPFCKSTIHEDAEVCPSCNAVKGYGPGLDLEGARAHNRSYNVLAGVCFICLVAGPLYVAGLTFLWILVIPMSGLTIYILSKKIDTSKPKWVHIR